MTKVTWEHQHQQEPRQSEACSIKEGRSKTINNDAKSNNTCQDNNSDDNKKLKGGKT